MVRLLPLVLLACTVDPEVVTPDLLLTNATFRLDGARTTHALALLGDTVSAVGDDAMAWEGQVETVHFGGATLVPGLHDAHTHLLAGAFVMERITMISVSDMEAVVDMVDRYAVEHPEEPWIIGFGWTSSLLGDPDGRLLDAVLPDRPAALINRSGHSALVNSAALAAAGIDADTPDPEDGIIVRDETGAATGLLVEGAMGLVMPIAVGAFSDEAIIASLRPALETFADAGLTSISEILAAPGVSLARPDLYAQLDAAGELPLRVHYYLPVFDLADFDAIDAERDQHDGDRLRFAGAKIWVDGAMSSNEAFTRGTYATSGTHGSHYVDAVELTAMITEAETRAMDVKIHTNGDAALDLTLDALEAVDAVRGLTRRYALEHIALADDGHRTRMAALGVLASVQPTSLTLAPLASWHRELEDWEVDEAYDLGALRDAGVPLALGTDWPVWPIADGTMTLGAAMGDRRPNGLTPAEALDAFTAGSGSMTTPELGCLDVGCIADITVLDRDPVVVESEGWAGAVVEDTWVGGQPAR